jgi:hypothetical protein
MLVVLPRRDAAILSATICFKRKGMWDIGSPAWCFVVRREGCTSARHRSGVSRFRNRSPNFSYIHARQRSRVREFMIQAGRLRSYGF